MDWFQVIFLSILQGITEFLPISSSAHLILPSLLLGWEDQGLVFDVAVHFGTLLAVVLYFKDKLLSMTQGVLLQAAGKGVNEDATLAWQIVLATIPAVIAGFIVNLYFEESLRQLWIVATTTLVFGMVLWMADRRCPSSKALTYKLALIIGLSQCLALIPGVSRSGITMTAALFLGLSREGSAEFSFLLSIPLIIAATVLKSVDLIALPGSIDWPVLLTAVAISGVSAYLCIRYFLAFIQKIGFAPFVLYRLVLGGGLMVALML